MQKIFRNLIMIVVAVGIFAAGTMFGAYYSQELGVLYRMYTTAPANSISNTTSTDPVTSDQEKIEENRSTLVMSTLEKPLPLLYSDTLEEESIQQQLKAGAVVLPLGTSFGEPGNVVITAHSSGTAAFGEYRFAFAKLGELKKGEEFRITTPTAVYTYRVYSSEIVWPHQVDKLPRDDRSTVTLVTCWPLWTNFKRLLVHSELVNTENHL
jgi:LPXTG-site transpeptidase (sortase) family protein